MRFLMTYANDPSTPTTPEKMAEIGRFTQEMSKSGMLVMTGGLVRPNPGTKVRYTAGKFSVTDGPYAETKELIDGFVVMYDLLHDDSHLQERLVPRASQSVASPD